MPAPPLESEPAMVSATWTIGSRCYARARELYRYGREGSGRCMSDDEDAPFPDPIAIPIEDALDLHAFLPRETPAVVASYLEAAASAGFREVRLIHGRGSGVQRQRVRETLSRHPLVERFADAPPERGGWGATIAWLKP